MSAMCYIQCQNISTVSCVRMEVNQMMSRIDALIECENELSYCVLALNDITYN